MQKSWKNQLLKKSKDMIYLLAMVLVFFILWAWLPAHNRVMVKDTPTVAISAPYAPQQSVAVDYSQRTAKDSVRLIRRFARLGGLAKQRTAVIERLRSDSAHLQAEADSLFCEVVNNGLAGQ